jgi:hypothetical protein
VNLTSSMTCYRAVFSRLAVCTFVLSESLSLLSLRLFLRSPRKRGFTVPFCSLTIASLTHNFSKYKYHNSPSTSPEKMTNTNGSNGNGSARVGTSTVKQGLAQMLKGGVIVSATKIKYNEFLEPEASAALLL